jgi:hypothetical protein
LAALREAQKAVLKVVVSDAYLVEPLASSKAVQTADSKAVHSAAKMDV